MATKKRLIYANAIEYPEYFYTREKAADPFIEGFHQGKIDAITDIIALAPTVDAVEVVHGRWIPSENGGYHCSICDKRFGFVFDNYYCPNCGAKMDGDGNA